MPVWISLGALGCALAVVVGAFGAHGLKARLSADDLALWETAARYLLAGSTGLVLLGLAAQVAARPMTAAGWCLAVGTAIFSGTVATLALGGPRWLGAVTPIGGTLMILGFLLFAWGTFKP